MTLPSPILAREPGSLGERGELPPPPLWADPLECRQIPLTKNPGELSSSKFQMCVTKGLSCPGTREAQVTQWGPGSTSPAGAVLTLLLNMTLVPPFRARA